MDNKEIAKLIAETYGEDGWRVVYRYQDYMSIEKWEELCEEFAQSLAEKN